MGVGALIGAIAGIASHRQQKKTQKVQEKAIEEATKVRATDIVSSTEAEGAETAELGSTNRKNKRRGKSSLTINRDSVNDVGTGLNIR